MSDSPVEEESPTASRVALDNWVVYGLFGALTLAGVAISASSNSTQSSTPGAEPNEVVNGTTTVVGAFSLPTSFWTTRHGRVRGSARRSGIPWL